MKKKRILPIIAVIVVILAAVAVLIFLFFGKSGPIMPPEMSEEDGGFPIPQVQEMLQEAMETNSDVVGWLYLPGTAIHEAVAQGPNNEFYLRKDLRGKYSYSGTLYMDFRNDPVNLSKNTIIYGHNLGSPLGLRDDPDGVKFAQLLKYADLEFARANPYFYFVTEDKSYVFQIFTVFYAEAYTKPVQYHSTELSDQNFSLLIQDVIQRSEHLYDVTLLPGDKIMSLSTCTYRYGSYSQNPNQRFVVMGRLVKSGEKYHAEASVVANPDPKPPEF